MTLEITISPRSAGIILATATVFLCVKHFIDREQGHDHPCILEQIEESNMKRLLDMTRAQPRRDTVALEIVHQCPEASTPGRSLFATVILVFLPFGARYILSYFFRTINALISGALTSELHFGATQRTGETLASKCAPFGFFLSEFLAAMHESRRCQAAREIRRFEHLVLEARAYEARARQAHMQPEDRAVPAQPPWRTMRASTLGQAWLAFAHWIAKPSARKIGGKQSS
jgi:flagellar biosynthesis regulator FlbT